MEQSNPYNLPIEVIEKLNSLGAFVQSVEVMAPEHFVKYHLSNGQVVHMIKPDTGNEPHNHPWGFDGEILKGDYREVIYEPLVNGSVNVSEVWRRKGEQYHTPFYTIHLLPEMTEGEVWTLITPGKFEQDSGFFRFNEEGVWFRYHYEPEFRLVHPML